MASKKKVEKHGKFYRALIDFGENTSFHGVKYAVSSESSTCEKVFWILVVMLGFSGAIYMTLIFWDRFSSNPIRITIQPVHKQTTIIPFPGVTICTAIRQLPNRVDALLQSLNLPEGISLEEAKEAFPSLMAYTEPTEVDRESLAILDKIFRMNGNYSVAKIFAAIEPKCENMLIKCRWEHTVIPCSDLFKTTLTHDGHCCSFNSNIEIKPYKQFRTLFYGPQMGLSVILNPETANISQAMSTLSSTGVKILIHSPEDYPGISSIEKILGNGTETYIRVLGTRLTSSENVKQLTPEQRSCLFEDENGLQYFPIYRDTNCGVECRMKALFRYCKCIPFTYPKSNKRICNINDTLCISRNYNAIYLRMANRAVNDTGSRERELPCNCPSQCNDVFYAVQTSSIPITHNVPTVTNFYDIDDNLKVSDRMVIHIYFGSYYQTEMLRDTITSTYYLLSSFGGVFSLFLGCSFLSILEILYFFCYRIFTKYND